MSAKHGPPATFKQVTDAIENFTNNDLIRLYAVAKPLLFGTRFASPDDLINETIERVLAQDRRWPTDVPFMVFLINAMKSVANGVRQLKYINKEVLEIDLIDSNCNDSIEDSIEQFADDTPDPQEILLINESQRLAKDDLSRIEEHFKNDDKVTWILLGIDDGCSPSEIREMSEMTLIDYETARKRLHRGLDQLFPGRRRK